MSSIRPNSREAIAKARRLLEQYDGDWTALREAGQRTKQGTIRVELKEEIKSQARTARRRLAF